MLPGKQLTALPPTHEIFRQPKLIEMVKARPALAAKNGNQTEMAPVLQGIEVNGSLAVIYSPYDCSAGWERAIAPYPPSGMNRRTPPPSA